MSNNLAKRRRPGQHGLEAFFILEKATEPVPYTSTYKRVRFLNSTPFSSDPVYCYIIKGRRAFTLRDISELIKKRYKAVQKAFNRLTKKTRLDGVTPVLQKNEHYILVNPTQLFVGDNLSPAAKHTRDDIYLLFLHGVNILFGSMRGEYKDEMFYELNDVIFKRFVYSRTLPYNAKPVLELPRMGEKHYSTLNNDLVDSRGEQIIADILYSLGVDYQPGVYFHSLGLNVDFVVKSEPLTVIEYWGLDSQEYKNNRVRKEEIYKELNWRLISIEAEEVEEAKKVKLRLAKEFGIFLNDFPALGKVMEES